MIPEKLALEHEVAVSSFAEAMELASTDFMVRERGADLKDLTLNDDGTLVSGDVMFPITDWAFESLCEHLKIPVKYARGISSELLIQSFDSLKETQNKRIKLLLSRDTIINVVDHTYTPAKNVELLTRIENDIVPQAALQLNAIALSDRGIEVSFFKNGQELEPLPGDVTKFGLSISNSQTGWRGAKADFYLHRLVCTNGAVVSNGWGTSEWSYDGRISLEKSYNNFIGQIAKMQADFAKIENTYRRLLDRELWAYEYVNIFRRLSRIVGIDAADKISQLSQEERSRLMAETRDGNRRLPSGAILYDLYNRVTAAART